MQACPGGAGRFAKPGLDDENLSHELTSRGPFDRGAEEPRVALALYGEDTLGTLGAVEAEVRRTLRWLEEERPVYWQEQIKRRREQVAMARAEVFRRNLQKRPDYNPPMSEQKESLAQGRGQLARRRETAGHGQEVAAVLRARRPRIPRERSAIERSGGRRCSRGVNLLTRIIDALEAYLQVAPPSGLGLAAEATRTRAMAPAQFVSIATRSWTRARPPLDAEARRSRAAARATHQAEAPVAVAVDALPTRATMFPPTNLRIFLFDGPDRGSAKLLLWIRPR